MKNLRIVEVSHDSMKPTINPGQFLICRKVKKRDLSRGSIFLFTFKHKLLIKRLLGLPNENVQLKGGRLYINGCLTAINLRFLREGKHTWDTAKNEYVMIGDNPDSFDSRKFGLVPLEQISLKPILRLWPLKKIN